MATGRRQCPPSRATPFHDFVIPTLSAAEGEGSAFCGKLQIPRFARDDKIWRIEVGARCRFGWELLRNTQGEVMPSEK
jgi:hypothetical protein